MMNKMTTTTIAALLFGSIALAATARAELKALDVGELTKARDERSTVLASDRVEVHVTRTSGTETDAVTTTRRPSIVWRSAPSLPLTAPRPLGI